MNSPSLVIGRIRSASTLARLVLSFFGVVCCSKRTSTDEMGRMYDVVILGPVSGEVGIKTTKYIFELLRKDLRWAIAGGNIEEINDFLEELKKEGEGRSLPGIYLFLSMLFKKIRLKHYCSDGDLLRHQR